MPADLSSLGYVIEFSIGLAGFSGIISVLSISSWGKLEHYRTLVLLLSSLIPAFAAFTALIWHSFLEVESAWRASALSFFLMLLPLLVVITFGRKRFGVRQYPQFNKHRVNFATSILLLAATFQIMVLLGAAPHLHRTAFLAGLVGVLLVGVIQFFAALIHARRDTNDATSRTLSTLEITHSAVDEIGSEDSDS
jgi:hypothetical protein